MMPMGSRSRLPSEAVAGRVTAIIPTYNRRELVAQAARSVLAQTYADVECLVVDNGSSDGTTEALRAMGDKRLRVVACELPLGAAKARNIGIDAAGTPWVAFLDNDDLWAPTKLELQLNALVKFPSARWSATGCAYVRSDLTVRPGGRLNGGPLGPPEGEFVGGEALLGMLSTDNVIPGGGSSVLVARELALEAGGFHDDVPGCEDWDFWVRLARLSPMVYLDRPLAAWRMWEGQGSTDANMMMRSANIVRTKYFPELGPFGHQYGYTWQASAARRYLSGGNRVRAAKQFLLLARIGKAPGQLAYAVAALLAPSVAERRLERIEPRADPEWAALAEPWLRPPSPDVSAQTGNGQRAAAPPVTNLRLEELGGNTGP
jgi:glycosyltransferase involved in cell wall biosynthesis